jgi:hypothetical protein
MSATVFGAEGTPLGPSVTEYRVGPWRAVIVDREHYRLAGRRFEGCWQLRDGGSWNVVSPRASSNDAGEVTKELEHWLRVFVAETCGALGLELLELGS